MPKITQSLIPFASFAALGANQALLDESLYDDEDQEEEDEETEEQERLHRVREFMYVY